MEQAFQKAKIALSEAAILAHLQSEPEMSLAVDASNHHVGRVLQQRCGSGWQLLAFFSRKLNAAGPDLHTPSRRTHVRPGSNNTGPTVAEYTADIQHMPGVENVVADALSQPRRWRLWCRPPLQGCSAGLSWPRLRLCSEIWPPCVPSSCITW